MSIVHLPAPGTREAQVELISKRDADHAVQKTLDQSGTTYEALRDEARNGRFKSERNRLLWAAVRDR